MPQLECYAARAVYLSNTCYQGKDAIAACMKKVDGITVSCERTCACERCPFEYARCIDDGACRFINACAELEGCRGVKECQSSNCGALFPISGGLNSLGAQLFDAYSSCMMQVGCGCGL